MKYSNEKEMNIKIRELFAYRRITNLFEKCGLKQSDSFPTHLVALQFQIYLLDAYLESTWALDKSKLAGYWENIKTALAPFELSEKAIKSLLREIRVYEHIEANCRIGKWPTEVPFKKFYTTKSCDVRLVRHLLYSSYPELNNYWEEDAWKYYDLITEINDDVGDVIEDLNTYNGNRFLISILRHGHLATKASYDRFLSKTAFNAEAYFRTRFLIGENVQLFEWTAERAIETKELLDQTIHTLDHTLSSSSLLLQKME